MSYVILLLLCFVSCNTSPSHPSLETQLNHYNDKVMTRFADHPDSAFKMITYFQHELLNKEQGVDSVGYYFLEKTRANLFYYQYQDSLARAINYSILGYCHRQAHTENINILSGMAHNSIGVDFQLRNEIDSAINHYILAYQQLAKSTKVSMTPDVCINIGDVYRKEGKYSNAAHWTRKALFIADSLGTQDMLHAIYVSLGEIYTYIGNFELASQCFNVADTTYQAKTPYELFVFHTSYGNHFFYKKNYDLSLEHMYSAYAQAKRLKSASYLAIASANIAENYLWLKQLDSSAHYLEIAQLQASKEDRVDEVKQFYLNGLAVQLYLNQHKLDKASHYLQKMSDHKKVDMLYRSTFEKRLADYYSQKGNYSQAYHHLIKHKNLEDSIQADKHANYIGEIDARYAHDTTMLKKDFKLKANAAQLTLQYWLLFFSSVLIACLIALFINYRQLVTKRRLEAHRKKIAEVTRLQIDANKSKFSAHFMLNVLNAMIPELSSSPHQSNKIDLLVQLFRHSLGQNEGLVRSLEEELSIVNNFALLYKSAYPHLPDINYAIDSSINPSTVIPAMIIQSFIENSLKYAFPSHLYGASQKTRKPRINLAIQAEVNCYIICISDNGIGYKESIQHPMQKKRTTGKGLLLLNRSLELLNDMNKEHIHYEMTDFSEENSNKNGTQIMIHIPYKFNYSHE